MNKNGLKIILASFFLTTQLAALAQNEFPKYWIAFTDKDNTPFSLDSPNDFLSERSIERRLRQNIELTEEDLPADPQYIIALKDLGIEVINVSKWFNGAIIASDDTELIDSLDSYSYIKSVPILIKPSLSNKILNHKKSEKFSTNEIPSYGYSSNQIEMLHGEYLHHGNF